MFRVIEDPQFDIDVPVEQPDGALQTLKTRFRAVPVDELRAAEAGEIGLADLLERAVIDFADLVDAAGDPVSGPDWRARVLALPWVQTSLYRSYSLALYRARAGNFARSAAPGRTDG